MSGDKTNAYHGKLKPVNIDKSAMENVNNLGFTLFQQTYDDNLKNMLIGPRKKSFSNDQ